ncbi:2-hydroxycarboxylate transporter family protein [Candidatus Phytoplasma oryzae]|uniref:2-hydroxycarboxylate transporter family protein n=1 Tax=Candidatus Phytoplasma oryzae TaxID=203274 RepID=A0A139JQC1_9MOLU|nr:2-hydroxycarboxylate transporter family protein [Candidatus Phytoplasma oryzae]KXT29163.1 2-hydroxycarboxylate transporter family protein [Candidatus Phytoplasma oryzae]
MNYKKKIKISELPINIIISILIISIIHIAISYNYQNLSFDKTFHTMISILIFAMSLASILKIIGKNTPILKDIGGGAILCLLIPAFIFNYNFPFLGNSFIKFQNTFKLKAKFLNSNYTINGEGIGFSDFFVSSLVAGSLLNIDKKIIKKTLKKFLPLVLLSLTISAIIVGLIGILLNPIQGISSIPGCDGGNFANAIFFIFVPIASGGITCGIVPLTQIFAQGNTNNIDLYRAHILPSLLIGGIASIIFGGLIKKIFKKTKYNNPEGIIEKFPLNRKSNEIEKKEENRINNENKKDNIQNITNGLILVFAFYTLSSIIRNCLTNLFPMIQKYIPPTIVFLVMIILLIKVLNILSSYYTKCIKQSSELITKSFSSAILVIVGIGTDINKIIENITNFSFLFTCLLCVLTTALAAAIIGNKMGYYPVQSSIAAGLCANSIGGAGNLAILEAAEEQKLLPYAQISTRLGGDIIVIIASILFPIVFHNLSK